MKFCSRSNRPKITMRWLIYAQFKMKLSRFEPQHPFNMDHQTWKLFSVQIKPSGYPVNDNLQSHSHHLQSDLILHSYDCKHIHSTILYGPYTSYDERLLLIAQIFYFSTHQWSSKRKMVLYLSSRMADR